jgi:hypothetical protein
MDPGKESGLFSKSSLSTCYSTTCKKENQKRIADKIQVSEEARNRVSLTALRKNQPS